MTSISFTTSFHFSLFNGLPFQSWMLSSLMSSSPFPTTSSMVFFFFLPSPRISLFFTCVSSGIRYYTYPRLITFCALSIHTILESPYVSNIFLFILLFHISCSDVPFAQYPDFTSTIAWITCIFL